MANRQKQSNVLRVVQEAVRLGKGMSAPTVRNMIKFTFADPTLAPETVNPRFVASNLEAILTKFDNLYGEKADLF